MSRATNRHYLNALEREWGAPTTPAPTTAADETTVDLTKPRPATNQPTKKRAAPKKPTFSAPPAGTWILLCPQTVADYLDRRDPDRGVAEVVIELIRTHSEAIRAAFLDGTANQQTGTGKTKSSFRPGRSIRYPVKISTKHHDELQRLLDDMFGGVAVEKKPKSPIHVVIVAHEIQTEAGE